VSEGLRLLWFDVHILIAQTMPYSLYINPNVRREFVGIEGAARRLLYSSLAVSRAYGHFAWIRDLNEHTKQSVGSLMPKLPAVRNRRSRLEGAPNAGEHYAENGNYIFRRFNSRRPVNRGVL
jgi:hypothetical protein